MCCASTSVFERRQKNNKMNNNKKNKKGAGTTTTPRRNLTARPTAAVAEETHDAKNDSEVELLIERKRGPADREAKALS